MKQLLIILLLTITTLSLPAQTKLTDYQRIQKTILDGQAVLNAGSDLPPLKEAIPKLEAAMQQLQALLGFRDDFLPIEFTMPDKARLSQALASCTRLEREMQGCRDLLKQSMASIPAEDLDQALLVLSLHPGCYYLGMDSGRLCDNPLKSELASLEIQDFPIYEALESDACLKELPALSPGITHIYAFGCEIDDASLNELNLGQLKQLKVLELDENELTTVPSVASSLPNLQYLSLRRCKITSVHGLTKELQHLRYLDLRANPIPPLEIEALKKALPNTVIAF